MLPVSESHFLATFSVNSHEWDSTISCSIKRKNPAEAGFLYFSEDYIFYFMRAIVRVCVNVPDESL